MKSHEIPFQPTKSPFRNADRLPLGSAHDRFDLCHRARNAGQDAATLRRDDHLTYDWGGRAVPSQGSRGCKYM